MNENTFFCLRYLILEFYLILIILDLIWLDPIMNNSKEEEPHLEIGSFLIPKFEHKGSLTISLGDCEKNLYNSLKNGVYETFNFKMNQILKYSTGLFAIIFIELGLIPLLYGFGLLISCLKDSLTCKIFFCIIYLLSNIALLLNFVFFILFSVNLYKEKIDDFKDFSKCIFFDKRVFNKTYDYIFLVYINFKKVFIVNLIYLCIKFCTIFINMMFIFKNYYRIKLYDIYDYFFF